MNTANSTHGLTTIGADSDGHNGYVRGIGGNNGSYTAITGAQSKTFKTLGGAIRWMAVRGYDAYGRRI